MSQDSFKTRSTLKSGNADFTYYSLPALEKATGKKLARLPISLRVLLENLLRHEDNKAVMKADIEAVLNWQAKGGQEKEINFTPARVVLQDFTGVPCVVDLATMREAVADMGGDPKRINPLQPVDLVIDHSVQVDNYGTSDAQAKNVEIEYERNGERYSFLRWGQGALKNFRVVPPGTGIIHQVNVEYLASVVFHKDDGGKHFAYPDTLVGTDSHTTMVNGLGVLGWGVGGIEAEAAMLGQPSTMLIPEVVGFKLTGKLTEGITATDLVLTVTQMLRKLGVVGKFVEFYGPGLDALTLADRATIANMAPEYGATCGFFPVDDETLSYLRFTGRDAAQVKLVEDYLKAQGLFRTKDMAEPEFSATLSLDLATVVPSLAGPARPQDRVTLSGVAPSFATLRASAGQAAPGAKPEKSGAVAVAEAPKSVKVTMGKESFDLAEGAAVIAAITSCTNTSNPAVLMAAGLLAKKARALGLKSKPWVKTSLAPGSQVVVDYLHQANLLKPLEELGFNVVGFGCTTCIGNSGPLPQPVHDAISKNGLYVASVLSGNRNFEGRVHPLVRANYLASPPLVVAYALAGRVDIDLSKDPVGQGTKGPVYLKDIWPSNKEVQEAIAGGLKPEMFKARYGKVFEGDERWRGLPTPKGDKFAWEKKSTYVRKAPFFDGMAKNPGKLGDIKGARCLAYLGDSVTTDHISPAGDIAKKGPAADYLRANGVSEADFNSFGSRRGNHEVMMRGTFANIRIKNKLVAGVEGGVTRHLPTNAQMSIYDASMKYQADKTPLIVIGGAEYGTGSSRDWAAKGTLLLGIKAVIVKSFERIHRSNLIGMGVLPLQFKQGEDAATLGLTGEETFELSGIEGATKPGFEVKVSAKKADGKAVNFTVKARVDTPVELGYLENGGILHYVLRGLAK